MFSAIFYHLRLIFYKLSRHQFAVVFGAGLAVVLIGTLVYSWLEA